MRIDNQSGSGRRGHGISAYKKEGSGGNLFSFHQEDATLIGQHWGVTMSWPASMSKQAHYGSDDRRRDTTASSRTIDCIVTNLYYYYIGILQLIYTMDNMSDIVWMLHSYLSGVHDLPTYKGGSNDACTCLLPAAAAARYTAHAGV